MPFNQVNSDNGDTKFVSTVNSLEAIRMSDRFGQLPARDYVIEFDDFLGRALDTTQWHGVKGSDAGAVIPTINSQAGGVVRLTSAATNGTFAVDGSSLTGELNFLPSQGDIFLETRLKIVSSVANVAINFGLTDSTATGTFEMPISISGTTITSNATDAAVFVFDTAQTNDFFHCQAVKTDVDTAILNTGIAPVADTYIRLGIIIDTAGSAYFFINDVQVGQVANAVNPATRLCTIWTVATRTTANRSLDVDYRHISQKRI